MHEKKNEMFGMDKEFRDYLACKRATTKENIEVVLGLGQKAITFDRRLYINIPSCVPDEAVNKYFLLRCFVHEDKEITGDYYKCPFCNHIWIHPERVRMISFTCPSEMIFATYVAPFQRKYVVGLKPEVKQPTKCKKCGKYDVIDGYGLYCVVRQ